MRIARSRSSIYDSRNVVELFLLVLRVPRRSLANWRYAHTRVSLLNQQISFLAKRIINFIYKVYSYEKVTYKIELRIN